MILIAASMANPTKHGIPKNMHKTPHKLGMKFNSGNVLFPHNVNSCATYPTIIAVRIDNKNSTSFELADKLVELETYCECGNPATLTGRYVDGKLVKTGEQIVIGDDIYKPMCLANYLSIQ